MKILTSFVLLGCLIQLLRERNFFVGDIFPINWKCSRERCSVCKNQHQKFCIQISILSIGGLWETSEASKLTECEQQEGENIAQTLYRLSISQFLRGNKLLRSDEKL
jgi:hypothetical protein